MSTGGSSLDAVRRRAEARLAKQRNPNRVVSSAALEAAKATTTTTTASSSRQALSANGAVSGLNSEGGGGTGGQQQQQATATSMSAAAPQVRQAARDILQSILSDAKPRSTTPQTQSQSQSQSQSQTQTQTQTPSKTETEMQQQQPLRTQLQIKAAERHAQLQLQQRRQAERHARLGDDNDDGGMHNDNDSGSAGDNDDNDNDDNDHEKQQHKQLHQHQRQEYRTIQACLSKEAESAVAMADAAIASTRKLLEEASAAAASAETTSAAAAAAAAAGGTGGVPSHHYYSLLSSPDMGGGGGGQGGRQPFRINGQQHQMPYPPSSLRLSPSTENVATGMATVIGGRDGGMMQQRRGSIGGGGGGGGASVRSVGRGTRPPTPPRSRSPRPPPPSAGGLYGGGASVGGNSSIGGNSGGNYIGGGASFDGGIGTEGGGEGEGGSYYPHAPPSPSPSPHPHVVMNHHHQQQHHIPPPPPSPRSRTPPPHRPSPSFEDNSTYRGPSTIDTSEVFPAGVGGGGEHHHQQQHHQQAMVFIGPSPSRSFGGGGGSVAGGGNGGGGGSVARGGLGGVVGASATGCMGRNSPVGVLGSNTGRHPIQALELRRNDNAFHVVANVVADRLLPKVGRGGGHGGPSGAQPHHPHGMANGEFYDVDPSDRAFLDRMLPVEVRRNFVDALRERAATVTEEPRDGERTLDELVRRCCWLGLDRPEGENPLLNANIRTVQVGFSAPPNPEADLHHQRYSRGRYDDGASVGAGRARERSLSPAAIRQYDVDSLERRRREVVHQEQRLLVRHEDMERRQMEAEQYLNRRQTEVGGYDAHARSGGAVASPPRRRGAGENNGGVASSTQRQRRSRDHHLKNMSSLSGDTGSERIGLGGGGAVPATGMRAGVEADAATRISTADSIARQQAIAELREASALLANSVTPEAANFWKAHVMELQARLRVLNGDDTSGVMPGPIPSASQLSNLSSAGAGAAAAASSPALSSTSAAMHVPPTQTVGATQMAGSPPPSPSPSRALLSSHGDYLPPEEAAAALDASKGTGASLLLSARTGLSCERGSGGGGDYVAPNIGVHASSNADSANTSASMAAATTSSRKKLVADPKAVDNNNGGGGGGGGRMNKSGASKPEPISSDGFPMVDVVAPADLPEGYTFEAQIGTKRFLATIPPGGVARGEKFTCPMRDLDRVEIDVPAGKWRDGLADCLAHGVFHPLMLNTIFMPHVALGQIMARNNLTWLGRPGSRFQSKSICSTMFMIVLFWIAMNCVALFIVEVHIKRGVMPSGVDAVCLATVNLTMLVYTVYAVSNVRATIRKRYRIPKQYISSGQEDVIMSMFCMPCTIAQMGRHTADYETYRAVCCSNTGLPRGVELASVPAVGSGMQLRNDADQVV